MKVVRINSVRDSWETCPGCRCSIWMSNSCGCKLLNFASYHWSINGDYLQRRGWNIFFNLNKKLGRGIILALFSSQLLSYVCKSSQNSLFSSYISNQAHAKDFPDLTYQEMCMWRISEQPKDSSSQCRK